MAQPLAAYLPTPVVVKDGRGYHLDYNRPKSIGRVRNFFGSVGVLVRMYCYIRTHGPEGLRRIAEDAVLNANYLLVASEGHAARAARRPLHARVRGVGRRTEEPLRDISAMDIAKRLLDYGFHAPTVYFPLIVHEAMMIEPTETESKATLDAFADAIGADRRGVARVPARRPAQHGHLPARRGHGGTQAGVEVESGGI